MWATMYSMKSESDFDTQLRTATALQLPHADGVARSPLFFVRADGKAHIMLAGGDGFTKKSPGAMVCQCCGANRETVLRKFGGQEVLDRARKVARTVRPRKRGADKANAKGQVRIKLGAAAHFVKARLWGPLLQLVAPVIGNHQVGGRPWVDACTEWWEAFAAMAQVAWKDDFLSGAEQRALLQRQLTMGARHLDLGWGKTLWMHMSIDHMYAYVARWKTIAKFSCFALEGSHVRLKRLLRNSGGVSLRNNRLDL